MKSGTNNLCAFRICLFLELFTYVLSLELYVFICRWQDIFDSEQQFTDETGSNVRVYCWEPTRKETVSSMCSCTYRSPTIACDTTYTWCNIHLLCMHACTCIYVHLYILTLILHRWEEAIKRAMLGTQGEYRGGDVLCTLHYKCMT